MVLQVLHLQHLQWLYFNHPVSRLSVPIRQVKRYLIFQVYRFNFPEY